MSDIKTGDVVRVKDRPDWVGGYKLADSEGTVIEVRDEAGFVVIHLDKTQSDIDIGTTLTFRLDAVEKA